MITVEGTLDEITAMLQERIAAGDFPSAVYLVADGDRNIYTGALGDAVREPEQTPATLDTIYDLASLTKPLVTGLLIARRIEQNRLSLAQKACEYLPEFAVADKKEITLEQLLTHTAGLPAWLPLYKTPDADPEHVVSAIAAEKLEAEPGTQVIYSDLSFISLGKLLERMEGSNLIELT